MSNKPLYYQLTLFSLILVAIIYSLVGIGSLMFSMLGQEVDTKVEFSDYSKPTSTIPIPTSTKSINILVTCYTASPDETDDTPFITADGTDLRATKEDLKKYPKKDWAQEKKYLDSLFLKKVYENNTKR
jgi:hypothetical protein